ncbi:hypothetical protein HY988_03805 [Candidatus Micrarchaeota archaeon]|nr:hypothetical protein [Candidatus Micrarchaeota archaeon]
MRKNTSIDLAIVIPIHNDFLAFKKIYYYLIKYLQNNKNISKYEIIIGDNASSPKEQELVRNLSKKNKLKYFFTKTKGIGAGIRLALENVTLSHVFICGIDFPFGFKIIQESIDEYLRTKNALIIGSKAHKKSKLNIPITRRVFSKAFNIIVNLLFDLGVGDTQGTHFFSKAMYEDFNSLLSSDTPFLQTQICIYTKKQNYKIVEIPVNYTYYRSNSKINVFKDGFSMFLEAIKGRKREKKHDT